MVQLDRHIYEIAEAVAAQSARRRGALAALTVSAPATVDHTRLANSLRRELLARGLDDVEIIVRSAVGAVRVLSAEFDGAPR